MNGFSANKLSPNEKKSLFYILKWQCVPLQVPAMVFNNIEIKETNFAKSPGVIIDENLKWQWCWSQKK